MLRFKHVFVNTPNHHMVEAIIHAAKFYGLDTSRIDDGEDDNKCIIKYKNRLGSYAEETAAITHNKNGLNFTEVTMGDFISLMEAWAIKKGLYEAPVAKIQAQVQLDVEWKGAREVTHNVTVPEPVVQPVPESEDSLEGLTFENTYVNLHTVGEADSVRSTAIKAGISLGGLEYGSSRQGTTVTAYIQHNSIWAWEGSDRIGTRNRMPVNLSIFMQLMTLYGPNKQESTRKEVVLNTVGLTAKIHKKDKEVEFFLNGSFAATATFDQVLDLRDALREINNSQPLQIGDYVNTHGDKEVHQRILELGAAAGYEIGILSFGEHIKYPYIAYPTDAVEKRLTALNNGPQLGKYMSNELTLKDFLARLQSLDVKLGSYTPTFKNGVLQVGCQSILLGQAENLFQAVTNADK